MIQKLKTKNQKLILNFTQHSETSVECLLNLELLYNPKELATFDERWEEFLDSDKYNRLIFKRKNNKIKYFHKSWMPKLKNDRINLLILGGNPASHSTFKDIYFSFEGKGTEHRFWKVFRELGYWDINGKDPYIKDKFINLEYDSKFRVGLEVIFTFPSSASKPKWNGVAGIQRLFGKKAFDKIFQIEKERLNSKLKDFFCNQPGLIIAMQKDGYNAISDNKYDVNLATTGDLSSNYADIKIIGTPPTRWLYTKKMKQLLSRIKQDLG